MTFYVSSGRKTLAESQQAKKLVLIDAMSIVFRAFHAPMQMELRSPGGMPTKAIYIFVRTLRKILKDHRPDYVGVAFDLAAPTFRDKLLKNTRQTVRLSLRSWRSSFPMCAGFAGRLGWRWLRRKGTKPTM